MARQQTVSDSDILQAALRVIVRRGHDAFTLSEVAGEVGLSRAAIILRFKGTHALRLTLTAHIVELFAKSMRALPVLRGGDGLLELVAFIGKMIPTSGSLAAFMRTYHSNIDDQELAQLEVKRGAILHNAIAERMPTLALAREAAVTAFAAHIGGSLMQWQVLTNIDASTYLVDCTKAWLTIAGIPHDKHFIAAQPSSAAA
jgi:TetR/AcrR family macrolide resistance operon transcriptional repressor